MSTNVKFMEAQNLGAKSGAIAMRALVKRDIESLLSFTTMNRSGYHKLRVEVEV